MSGDWEMLSFRVPPELKELVDADPRNNQEIGQAALWREFGGERLGAIERQIEEKRKRVQLVEREKENRESELQELKKEIEALEDKADAVEETEQTTFEDAREALEGVPRNPDNPGIQNWADKLGMTANILIDKLEEHDD